MELDIGALAMWIRAGEDPELRGRHGQRSTTAEQIVEAHQAAPRQGIIGLVEGAYSVHLVDRPLLQVILKISPDALPIEDAINPERSKPFGGRDAGAVQALRRADRARAQDHFAPGAGLHDFAADLEAHAGRAALFDDQAIDQHVRFETQIGAIKRGLEEAARRRPAASALLVDVKIADPFIVARVEIRNLANSHLFGRFSDRVQNRPRQARGSDPPAAADAMVLAFAEEMIFEAAEGRQHVVISPPPQPELTPVT